MEVSTFPFSYLHTLSSEVINGVGFVTLCVCEGSTRGDRGFQFEVASTHFILLQELFILVQAFSRNLGIIQLETACFWTGWVWESVAKGRRISYIGPESRMSAWG